MPNFGYFVKVHFIYHFITILSITVPESAPLNVNATALSPTEILVTWEPPTPIDRNGIILMYEIELRQSTFSNVTNLTVTTVTASDPFNDWTASALEEYVTYTIYIRASTSIGSGPFSDPITETTHQARKYSSTLTHPHSHTHTHPHACTPTPTHPPTHTHTHMHAHPPTPTCLCINALAERITTM